MTVAELIERLLPPEKVAVGCDEDAAVTVTAP